MNDTDHKPGLVSAIRTRRGVEKMRRECFHHDPSTGHTWLMHRRVGVRRRDRFECGMCGKDWTVPR